MVLGLIRPLTKMSTRNLLGGKRRPLRKAGNLTSICEAIVDVSQSYEPPRRVTGIALHFTHVVQREFLSTVTEYTVVM
jgi:hypothetical protein